MALKTTVTVAVVLLSVAAAGCGDEGSADPADVPRAGFGVSAGEIADDMIAGVEGEGFLAGFCNDLVTRDEFTVYQAFRQAFGRDIVYNAFGREIDNDPAGDDEAFVRSVFVAVADRCP